MVKIAGYRDDIKIKTATYLNKIKLNDVVCSVLQTYRLSILKRCNGQQALVNYYKNQNNQL